MNSTIYKYPLAIIGSQHIRMPSGANILCAQVQNETLCLWASVDPKEKSIDIHTIRIIGTGHPAPDLDELHYIGTAQMNDGSLVWHVFEQP